MDMDTTTGSPSPSPIGERGEIVVSNKKSKHFLPDLIISNILSWLPPKYVAQNRIICKGWRALTMSPDFVKLHCTHGNPMILVSDSSDDHSNVTQLLLDKWWEPAQNKLRFHTFLFGNHLRLKFEALFSHGGLIVFKEYNSCQHFIIFNPVNLEKVTISLLPRQLYRSEIYGVFYYNSDPSLQECRTLWAIPIPGGGFFYKVLSLSSTPSMRTIRDPISNRTKMWGTKALLIDKYLYWMLEAEQEQEYRCCGHFDIMQFDYIKETFTVKPCPVPADTECDYGFTHLLIIDGTLSFLVIFTSKITIWSLVDHAKELWTSVDYYTFSKESFQGTPTPIAVVDGSLVLLSGTTLFVCNLLQGTMKGFRRYWCPSEVWYMSHQASLASLSNCPSTIYLNKKADVSTTVSLVNEDSDSLLMDSCPSYLLVENTSFEIVSSDEEDEHAWEKSIIKRAKRCVRKGMKASKQRLQSCLNDVLQLLTTNDYGDYC